jgi:hypothetical protein
MMKARGDSWGSVDSFSVVSVSDFHESDDEVEHHQSLKLDLSPASDMWNEVRITVDGSDAIEADNADWEEIEVECESAVVPSWSVTVDDDSELVASLEPHEIVADYCERPQPMDEDDIDKPQTRTRSRSSDAKEVRWTSE